MTLFIKDASKEKKKYFKTLAKRIMCELKENIKMGRDHYKHYHLTEGLIPDETIEILKNEGVKVINNKLKTYPVQPTPFDNFYLITRM